LWHASGPALDAASLGRAQRNLLPVQGGLRQKHTVVSRLEEVGPRARPAAERDVLASVKVNCTTWHFLRAVWVASGKDSYRLTNLRLV
jgi:hypothetical protein